jgi:hypothetical protein
MIKALNLKNLIILTVVLAVIHFGVWLLISPMLSSFVIAKINKLTGPKLYIEKANIWPLTLSLSLRNLKVFDPGKENQRIAQIGEASVYLSPLGLLSKRFVLSDVRLNNAEINLESEPDGTFNIQKLTQAKKAEEKKKAIVPIEITKEKIDWFGRVYSILKNRLSKDALEKQKAERYLIEIKTLEINNAYINLKSRDGRSVEVDKAKIILGNVGYDPELGFRVGRFNIAGNLKNQGAEAGEIEFLYLKTLNKHPQCTEFDIDLKNVNLDAVRFIYEDSLPVAVKKGSLNLKSKTILINDNIDSKNELSLKNHELAPKSGLDSSRGFMPVSVICEALNSVNPLKLNFEITGTVEKPEFSGFMKSLLEIVKPNFKNIGETLKSVLGDFLERKSKKYRAQDTSSQGAGKKINPQDVVNTLQSIFGGKKHDTAQ